MDKIKLVALLLCLSGPALAASAPDEKTRLKIAEYMLKTPTNEASPSVIEPFLTIDPETLPKRMRAKIRAKQLEIRTLLKLHDTKKKGSILQPSEGCTQASFVKPTSELPGYAFAGYEEITESEERQLLERTLCNEVDLGCHFSLVIFYDAGSKVPRKLYMSTMDPLMALVAAARGGSKAGVGGNGYFGTGISCMH